MRENTADTAVVIGSGLTPAEWPGKVLSEEEYDGIEGLAVPGVDGHPGRLVLLDTMKGRLLVFAGRTHLYEGMGWDDAGGTAAAAAARGCVRIIFTQAAGSLKRSLPVGSWMLPSDIVSMPLKGYGAVRSAKPAISRSLRERVSSAAAQTGIETADGILYWTSGPLYETPAEAEAALMMGADAATMSPLPELAAAAEKGLEAVCLSYITNFAPNVSREATGHMEVLEAGGKGAGTLSSLLPRLAGL